VKVDLYTEAPIRHFLAKPILLEMVDKIAIVLQSAI